MQKKYLECAEIINKRGIAGELKANCLCDGIEALSKVKTLYTFGHLTSFHFYDCTLKKKNQLCVQTRSIGMLTIMLPIMKNEDTVLDYIHMWEYLLFLCPSLWTQCTSCSMNKG